MVRSYLRHMRRAGEWGGGTELTALALGRRMRIEVFELDQRPRRDLVDLTGVQPVVIEPEGVTPRKTLHLLRTGDNHYDALLPVHSTSRS